MADDSDAIILPFIARIEQYETNQQALNDIAEKLADVLAKKGMAAMVREADNFYRQARHGHEVYVDTQNNTVTESGESGKRTDAILRRMLTEESDDSLSKDSQQQIKALQFSAKVTSQGFNALTSMTKTSINIVQDIYERLKSASPLLQAIETLFNLAMTLFFMPIGNKLAEVILPATLELVDAVVSMWDEFGGGGIGDMISYAIDKGLEIFGTYFINIGEQLAEQTGVTGDIGDLLIELGSFVKEDLEGIINTIVPIGVFLLGHIKEVLATLIALKSTEIMLQIASLYVQATDDPLSLSSIADLAIVTAVVSGLGSYAAFDAMTNNKATGGYVPSTAGGSLHVIGEGGEGEYVIPESKMGTAGLGGATYNFHINGVTSEELKSLINECIDAQISGARIRGAF